MLPQNFRVKLAQVDAATDLGLVIPWSIQVAPESPAAVAGLVTGISAQTSNASPFQTFPLSAARRRATPRWLLRRRGNLRCRDQCAGAPPKDPRPPPRRVGQPLRDGATLPPPSGPSPGRISSNATTQKAEPAAPATSNRFDAPRHSPSAAIAATRFLVEPGTSEGSGPLLAALRDHSRRVVFELDAIELAHSSVLTVLSRLLTHGHVGSCGRRVDFTRAVFILTSAVDAGWWLSSDVDARADQQETVDQALAALGRAMRDAHAFNISAVNSRARQSWGIWTGPCFTSSRRCSFAAWPHRSTLPHYCTPWWTKPLARWSIKWSTEDDDQHSACIHPSLRSR
ncbi:Aste57867_24532 [Aphanomyces stellatus]|uniref:Aste57867_24532 protein n=1 Tax=Aphanomyces stellatus TaxID=120398 RepID=A0A485LRD0_9STRA|nr:hypothetical protein As57867_024455 [Aphanomyces stellatus]VFU01171.1 Aste57867_24532 [Aphanomyces stellatus]